MANVLAALVLSKDANDPVVLFLNVGLEELKGAQSVALLLNNVNPATASGIVNEGDPVPKARERENRHLV